MIFKAACASPPLSGLGAGGGFQCGPEDRPLLEAIRAKPRVSTPPCLQPFTVLHGVFSQMPGEPAADMASSSERHQREFIFSFVVNRFSTCQISNTALLVNATYEVCNLDGQN